LAANARRGVLIRPPSETGWSNSEEWVRRQQDARRAFHDPSLYGLIDQHREYAYERNMVYMSRSLEYARSYAADLPGGGALYEVQAEGPLREDRDPATEAAFCAPAARVVAVLEAQAPERTLRQRLVALQQLEEQWGEPILTPEARRLALERVREEVEQKRRERAGSTRQ
jgi:hypothetical protein